MFIGALRSATDNPFRPCQILGQGCILLPWLCLLARRPRSCCPPGLRARPVRSPFTSLPYSRDTRFAHNVTYFLCHTVSRHPFRRCRRTRTTQCTSWLSASRGGCPFVPRRATGSGPSSGPSAGAPFHWFLRTRAPSRSAQSVIAWPAVAGTETRTRSGMAVGTGYGTL